MSPNDLKDFDFWAVLENFFFENTELQMPISRKWGPISKIWSNTFGKHPLVYICKLSFSKTPKTVIRGVKSEIVSDEIVSEKPPLTNVNFGTSRNPINLKLGRLKGPLRSFGLASHSFKLNSCPKNYHSLNFWNSLKNTYHPATKGSKSCSNPSIHMKFHQRLIISRAWCGANLSSIKSLFMEKWYFEYWKKLYIYFIFRL